MSPLLHLDVQNRVQLETLIEAIVVLVMIAITFRLVRPFHYTCAAWPADHRSKVDEKVSFHNGYKATRLPFTDLITPF